MKNIFVLNSVIRLIERNTAHAIRFARIGAALLLIAVGTLVFGACVLLTGTPLVVLFTAFVICSFIRLRRNTPCFSYGDIRHLCLT